jgi:membrane protease YdiL (CAAX protease family)
VRSTLALASAPPARAAGLGALVLALDWARALALRAPGQQILILLVGGLALCLLAVGRRPADLGLGRSRLPERLIGGLALAGVLLLPAAVRWGGGPPLGPALGAAAVAVSIGQEIAYRGVLFLAFEEAGGPALAIAGTTVVWTAGHALSHPPAFLPAVALAGLLLAAWRWALRDLVGPIIGHVLADLAL